MTRLPPAPRPELARADVERQAESADARPARETQAQRAEIERQNEELRSAQAALQASLERYVELYDCAPVGYLTLNSAGVVIEANLTGARLLGEERAQLVGSEFARYVARAERERWQQHAKSLWQQGESRRIELVLLGHGGCSFDAQLDIVRLQRQGAAPVLRVTLIDVTERKRVEAELRIAATAFEAQEGIMITDTKGVIVRVNTAFTQITGYSADEAVGRTPRLLRSGRHDAAFYKAVWDSLGRNEAWQGEVWNRRKNGELYPQWLTITAVRGDDARVARYVGTMIDISKRKSREDEIAKFAFYDPLTALPNRRLLEDRLHQALVAGARNRRGGALLFIDLDHFKNVNDTLGHDKGDLLLQQVAKCLTGCVREGDTVARLGGDEFVVMLAADLAGLPETAAAQARVVGQKILAALNRPIAIAGHEYHGSASIGVVLFSDHELSVDEMLQRADQAMYQAKAAGRNTLRFFDSAIQQALRRRSTLEAELRQAVQHGDFVLHYQGAFDRDRQLLGAEALVRWQHPRWGLVEPRDFIAVAEDTGLIHALGRWALETACAQLAEWSTDPQMARLHLSMNVSARQLRDERFVPLVLAVLDRSGANAARLKLELTETVMLDNLADTIAKMNSLRARGVSFSLDDFGTGYASLAYLKRLPLEQLKIDRSFVHEMLTNPHDAAIARTIVDLGRSLGLTVIAEGVETREQHDMLAGFGCHVFQGYLFGRPAPAPALRQWLRC